MADFTKEELAEAIAKANAKMASKSAPSSSGSSTGKVNLPGQQEFDIFGAALKGTGKTADALGAAYDKLKGTIEGGLDTWRSVSSSGASFNNDIVGMTAAAKGARMDMGEFGSMIKENSKYMSGFGGSVTRGAEEFARLSKKMYDDYSENTDQLKQLGYTSKDLNEIMALTSVSSRAQVRDSKEKDAQVLESAMKLSFEMDAMAKLTGKSREAQMEQMRKNERDMQFEAALRQKMIGMSESEKIEFEKNARKQLNEAQLRGQGDMFKEVFATGQVISKEAATQAAVNREQAQATIQQAKISSDKTIEAKERERQADAAALQGRRAFDADMQNSEKLRYASLGEAGGVVGKTVRDSMTAQIEYQRNFEKAATDMYGTTKNLSEEQKKAVQDRMASEVKSSQEGKNKEGQAVDGATKAMINLGNRVGDAESAMMNKLVKPLNEQVQPALQNLAGKLGGVKPGSTETRPQNWEREMGEGFEKGKTSTMLQKAGAATKEVGDAVNAVGAPKRQGGSLEMTGNIFENWGKGTTVELHGMESVMRPQDLEKLIETSLGGVKQSIAQMPKMSSASAASGGGVNVGEISKSISTTFSSVMGGASKNIQIDPKEMAEMTKPFEKSFEEFNLGFSTLTQKQAADLVKESVPTEAIDQTAAALEYASKRRQELEELMNDGQARSSAEWDEILDEAEQLDGQIEKLTEKQLDAMSKYSDGWGDISDLTDQISADIKDAVPYDEFAGLDKAIADQKAMDDASAMDVAFDMGPAMSDIVKTTAPTSAQANSNSISMDSFTIGPNGMPIPKPKSTAAAVPDKKAETKTASPGKKINPETGEEYTPVESASAANTGAGSESKSGEKKAEGASGKATLDDVVKAITTLNNKVGQLITTSEQGYATIARSAKATSNNLYERAKA